MKRRHIQMPFERKIPYLQQHGSHAISYSTLQQGLYDFWVQDIGYVSYANYWGYNFILGNPICSDENRFEFLHRIVRSLKNPVFAQITGIVGRLLYEQHGYKVTQLGIETYLPIQEYNLQNDTKKRNLRSYIRKGQEQSSVYELTKEQRESLFGIYDRS